MYVVTPGYMSLMRKQPFCKRFCYPGWLPMRIYELEMTIYESFFFTIVPLLGVLIYFGDMLYQDATGETLIDV